MLPIYVDYDDVLSDTTRICIQVANQMFGRNVSYEEVTSFNFQEVFDFTQGEFDDFMNAVHQPDILLSFEPIHGAIDVLNLWDEKGYKVYIVTGRPTSSYESSLEWLSQYHVPHHDFIMVDKYNRKQMDERIAISMEEFSKMNFCLAIEDSLEMAEYLSHAMGKPVVLFDKPWNRSAKVNGNITRYKSWDQIRKAFQLATDMTTKT